MDEINKNLYDCYFSCITDLSNYYGQKNDDYLFIDFFTYRYERKNPTVGENLAIRWIKDDTMPINSQYDYHIEDIPPVREELSVIKQFISREMKAARPVIVSCDIYDCPWTDYYHKYHIGHTYLVMSEDEEHYFCKDPYFQLQKCVLSKEELINKALNLRFIQLRNKSKSLLDIKELFLRYLKGIDTSALLSEGRLFAEDVFNMDIKREIDMADFYTSILLRKLKSFSRYRILYAWMLTRFDADYKIGLEGEISDINRLSELWDKFAMSVLKTFITDTFQIKRDGINTLIGEICSLEYEIINRLIVAFSK
ncbi:hypothetical protein CLHUN_10250 [Ruminiclostridium hungatei]|uniref:Butirosin biosynthesis protein H N-terminal domain-containing protein n=1 Tax=Ruminiclostridium hungatei TaxID=48256 RepID=A0A1V4SMM4_RUMHU|nr:hypothetical protein [Ruminiclostridium hungatei]OPX45138.1 hypothetical protein CLHUN_10250 [Ruminiclostridium hungatei]